MFSIRWILPWNLGPHKKLPRYAYDYDGNVLQYYETVLYYSGISEMSCTAR